MTSSRIPAAFLFVVAFLSIHECGAQGKTIRYREQFWFGYFNQTRLTDKFGFWFDFHYRMTDNFTDRPFQMIIRPAVTYYMKDNLRFMAGYGYINFYPAAGAQTSRHEHRGWQQIWWNQRFSGLTFLQWLRLEERYIGRVVNDQPQDGYDFNYRLRYNMSFFIPLKGKEMVAKTPFILVQNELFLNFGERIVYNMFDQNRLFVGLGYQFTPRFNAQLGYMNVFQQEAAGNSYISSDAIRLYVAHSLDWRSSE